MRIFIPTARRVGRQKTAETLAKAGLDFTLVCPRNEHHGVFMMRFFDSPGISAKRQFIMTHADEKFVMVDDDLTFYARSRDGKRHTICTDAQIRQLFTEIEIALNDYAHVSILDKFMSQAQPRKRRLGGRYIQVLAYNKSFFKGHGPWYRTELGAEHDVNLQLLKTGHQSCILTEWAKSDNNAAPGGCNDWRTDAKRWKACQHLKKLHPDVVTLVDKKTLKMKINWRLAAKIGGLR